MKTQTKFIWAVFLLFLKINNVNAQCFIAATTAESNQTYPLSEIQNTGNDVKDGAPGFMMVFVWGKTVTGNDSAGLGWNDNGGSNGVIPLSYDDAHDPDVALIESNGTWWAIVAYYSANGGGVYVDFCEYNSGNFTIPNSPILLSSDMANVVNVDGDDQRRFAIVWEDTGTDDIQVIVGRGDSSADPILGNSGTPISVANTDTCIQPDVSLYVDSTLTTYVYYTYLKSGGVTIYVTYDSFSNVWNGTSVNTQMYSADGNFAYPRVATPPDSSAGQYTRGWCVAVAKDSNIVSYTRYNGTDYFNNYTNASDTGICAINSPSTNKYPVVTYTNNFDGILVGWNSGYPNGSPFTADGNLAIHCYLDGNYKVVGSQGFMIVPDNNDGHEYQLSVAGRDNTSANDIMYTFFDDRDDKIYYKTVAYSSSNLRIGNVAELQPTIQELSELDLNISIQPNPFENEILFVSTELLKIPVDFSLYDIQGKLMFHRKGLTGNTELKTANIHSGFYFFKLCNAQGEVLKRGKLVKN